MGRTVVITEEELERFKENSKPSKYTFNQNVRHFLNVLLSDPINVKVPKCVEMAGLSKQQFLDKMQKFGIIEYHEHLDDKNKDGSFKDKVTMKVSYTVKDKVPDENEYRVPKNKFDEKVEKLRIAIFERNAPEDAGDTLEECDCASAMGGVGGNNIGYFIQPMSKNVIRR